MKLGKSILCCLAFMLVYSPYALSDDSVSYQAMAEESSSNAAELYNSSPVKMISNGAYIGGGVASIFLGLGIGTAIQGRYKWVHTVTQGLCFAGLITTGIITVDNALDNNKINWTTMSMYLGFGLALGGLRIWEIIDTWMLPDHYKIGKEPAFQVLPLAYYDQDLDATSLGLSLKYNF